MSIVPTGSPCWVKANDHTTYGGNVDKHNYQGRGVVNPLTDVSANQFCRLASDVAALQNVAEFATISFTCADAAPGAPTIDEFGGMVGTPPTGVRNGNGDVTFSFLASYLDDYGVAGPVNLAHAEISLVGFLTPGSCGYTLLDLDGDGLFESVRCAAFTVAGVAMVGAQMSVTVYTG